MQVKKVGKLQINHSIVQTDSFSTVESYVLYLLHRKAYEHAAEIASGKSLLDWGCNDGYGMELMRPHVAQSQDWTRQKRRFWQLTRGSRTFTQVSDYTMAKGCPFLLADSTSLQVSRSLSMSTI